MFKTPDESTCEFHRVERVVEYKRREVHSDDHLRGVVALARFGKGGVGTTAAGHGEIVAFATSDLGDKDSVEFFSQRIVSTHIHAQLLAVRHPIQIAPNLATHNPPGSPREWKRSDRLKDCGKYRQVSMVFVSGIVSVDNLGPCEREQARQIINNPICSCLGTRIPQLHHGFETFPNTTYNLALLRWLLIAMIECDSRTSPTPDPAAAEWKKTLASILRIPVYMHNLDGSQLFRPAAWTAFGTADTEGADFRACAILAKITECGIRNYSIYHKDGFLFSYFEYVGEDFEADMALMAADPRTQEWWGYCKPCQEPLESRQPGDWWASMEEMFHWD